jgi:hypothetical protein
MTTYNSNNTEQTYRMSHETSVKLQVFISLAYSEWFLYQQLMKDIKK